MHILAISSFCLITKLWGGGRAHTKPIALLRQLLAGRLKWINMHMRRLVWPWETQEPEITLIAWYFIISPHWTKQGLFNNWSRKEKSALKKKIKVFYPLSLILGIFSSTHFSKQHHCTNSHGPDFIIFHNKAVSPQAWLSHPYFYKRTHKHEPCLLLNL